jgi:FkbM family methyltransferase
MYYSQCGEDSFLNKYFFKNKQNGIYIELGALDGTLYSNTKFFEDTLNWKGILIEPHPDKYKLLQINRPSNFLFNELVSCNTEPQNFRYFVDEYASISGVENTIPKAHIDVWFDKLPYPQTSKLITPKTLTEIVKSTNITHIDFLSLDVEGHEYEVLQSWDFSVPIDLILIENPSPVCRQLLMKNGYKFIQKYEHNEICVIDRLLF